MKLKNKKAAGKYLSIWWVLVLVIIAVGITIGVLMFYSEKIDVRIIEARILGDRVFDCLDQHYRINQNIPKDLEIFSVCNLNQDIITNSGDYFIHLRIVGASNSEVIIDKTYGNSAFEKDCPLIMSEAIKAENYPRCINKSFILVNNGVRYADVEILVGSNYEYRGAL
jgi:hypothetical protein